MAAYLRRSKWCGKRSKEMWSGILPIYKPRGLRSTHCVEKIRNLFGRSVKTGHGGTLDSSASGVLVLLLGGATRLSSLVMQMPKEYIAVLQLGIETSTCDATGEGISTGDYRAVSARCIDDLLPSFVGWRMQSPPMISAVHVSGQRAHEIYRSGKEPEIEPRPVFIEKICRLGCLSDCGKFALYIRCGKGTYVRSIARDIGRKLGCYAHIRELTRRSVGPYTLGNTLKINDFKITREQATKASLPPTSLSEYLPSYFLADEQVMRLRNGMSIPFQSGKRQSYGKYAPKGAYLFYSDTMMTVAHLDYADVISVRPDVNINIEND